MGDSPEIRQPWWVRRPQLVQRIALIAIVFALGRESVRQLLDQAAPIEWAAVVLQTVGIVVVYRRRRWGLLLIAAAPVLSASVSGEVTVFWAVGVVAGFFMTYTGFAPWLVLGTVPVSNYAAVVIAETVGWSVNFSADEALTALTTSLAGVFAGVALRSVRAWYGAIERQAADAIEAREQESQRLVVEQRLRIARDLHDGIGHQAAVLSMQLSMAQVSLGRDEEATSQSLTAARETLKHMNAETRELLDVLRPSGGEDTAPAADHRAVPELVASFKRLGVDVRDVVALDRRDRDVAVSTATYRIVQEALTNARRHGVGPIELAVIDDPSCTTISVTNAFEGQDVPGRGYGLVGAKERAAAARGTFEINREDGRFTLIATLPLKMRSET